MKKLLTLTLASAISLALIGCGSSDKKTDLNSITLDFNKKGKATYDLSEYLFNKDQKTITKVDKTFTNKDGKKNYENLPDSDKETKYYTTTTEINGSTIKEFEDQILDTTSNILDDKISLVSEDINTNMIRYADKGDYFMKWNSTYTESGLTLNGITVCKITGHQDSITVNSIQFHDILKSTCTLEATSKDGQTLQGKLFELKSISDFDTYFAKDIGEVLSTNDGCEVVKLDDKVVSSECEKEITEIITIK